MKKDGMRFKAYPFGGWQCKIKTKSGTISVRYGSTLLFTDEEHPYEVWYPTEEAPDGYQTVEDIKKYRAQ